jgi:hypothetical protein
MGIHSRRGIGTGEKQSHWSDHPKKVADVLVHVFD